MNNDRRAFLIAAVLATTLNTALAQDQTGAQTPAASPSAQGVLQCAGGCKKTFYFSANSDPLFAEIRNACITGCGGVPDASMPVYQQCYDGCRELFPFRHSESPELAGFQRSCIVACRYAR